MYCGHVSAVDMHREELDGAALSAYPLDNVWQVRYQN